MLRSEAEHIRSGGRFLQAAAQFCDDLVETGLFHEAASIQLFIAIFGESMAGRVDARKLHGVLAKLSVHWIGNMVKERPS